MHTEVLSSELKERTHWTVMLNERGMQKFERGEQTIDLKRLVTKIGSLKVLSGNPHLSLHVELEAQDVEALRHCVREFGQVVEYVELEQF